MKLIIQPNIDQLKLQIHLNFIDEFGKWCREQGWRLVVYGGYGLDGYLQTITRNHGDIDLVIYSHSPRSQALAYIIKYLNQTISEVEVKSKDQDFLIEITVKSKSISGNFYYVQTANDPYQNLNSVIKLDGTQVTNSPKDFPHPVKGKIGKFEVEVQDQSAHLSDIFRKRKDDKSLSKHDQDIANIQTLLTK